MLSAAHGVAGSGKKPRKSRGKGLRTNTGWYVNIYTLQFPNHRYDPFGLGDSIDGNFPCLET
jgi:hypothetical protein